jgi:hypothetical protein
MVTEQMLRDYLAQFMKYVEVDDAKYTRQWFVDVAALNALVQFEECLARAQEVNAIAAKAAL